MDYSEQPALSVIISTNGGPSLRDCLKSCQSLLAERNAEIIVCVSDKTALPEFPELSGPCPVRLYKLNKTSIAEIRNVGLQAASGKIFLLLDDDCVLPSAQLVDEIIGRSQEKTNLHGGGYSLSTQSPYFPRVYNFINRMWLQKGLEEDQTTTHLLGGFLFGSRDILACMRFRSDLHWGGEEKELLQRLKSEHGITGKYHADLAVVHVDRSGFKKFRKRAFRQGQAAGQFNLLGKRKIKKISAPLSLWPGLALFYSLSRAGVLFGKFLRLKGAAIEP